MVLLPEAAGPSIAMVVGRMHKSVTKGYRDST
jgi:hypothetical protein